MGAQETEKQRMNESHIETTSVYIGTWNLLSDFFFKCLRRNVHQIFALPRLNKKDYAYAGETFPYVYNLSCAPKMVKLLSENEIVPCNARFWTKTEFKRLTEYEKRAYAYVWELERLLHFTMR